MTFGHLLPDCYVRNLAMQYGAQWYCYFMNDQNTHEGKESFFRDSKGNIAIWQCPNIPLTGWLVFKLLSALIESDAISKGCASLSTAFLFTWAYLEITSGISYFRRLLGAVVTIAIVVGFFR